MLVCQECGKNFADGVQCPNCGSQRVGPGRPARRWWSLSAFILLALFVFMAAIVVPALIRNGARSSITSCKSNLKNIGTAMEMYSTDFAGLYPTSLSLLTPRYLKTIPTCSSVGRVTYMLRVADHPDCYTVVCHGGSHGRAGITAPDFPQYTSISGLIERP